MTATTIDSKHVNISEKDVEEWLFNNPREVYSGEEGGSIVKWLARQFRVPSGIIDLLGQTETNDLCVVEVKNVEASAEALTQISRYAADIDRITWNWTDTTNINVYKVLICKGSLTNALQYEADALNVRTESFEVELTLTLSGAWKWTDVTIQKNEELYDQIAEFGIFRDIRDLNGWPEKPDNQPEENIIEEARQIIEEEQDKNEQV